MKHPVEAQRIGDLGVDYLIDWVRTWLLRRPTDPGYVPGLIERVARIDGSSALLRKVWENLGALTTLSEDKSLRAELESLRDMLSGTRPAETPVDVVLAPVTARLSAAVIRIESERLYRFGESLDRALCSDAIGILRTLALIRHCLAAGEPIPLAATLLPRDTVPASAPPGNESAFEVIEIGDLGDPFCRAGHSRVRAELELTPVSIRWRWLYFSSAQHWRESERVGALLEAVAGVAPSRFWEAVDRVCHTTPYGAEKVIPGILAEEGIAPERVKQWLAEDRNYDGLRHDRKMAIACGLHYVRPLFVIGRRLFFGLDAATAIREFAETLPAGGATV